MLAGLKYLLSLWTILLLPGTCDGRTHCSNPRANDGESINEECLRKTCKRGVWRVSISQDVCCFNGKAFFPGTTISTAQHDGCSPAQLKCVLNDVGEAKTILDDKITCGKIATKEQLQEVTEMLDDYLSDHKLCSETVLGEKTKTTKGCPDSWRKYERSCYRVIGGHREDCVAECERVGGYLAMIDTEEENIAVVSLLGTTAADDVAY